MQESVLAPIQAAPARLAGRVAASVPDGWLAVVVPIGLVGIMLLAVDATSAVLAGGGAFLLLLLPVVVVTMVLGPRAGAVALAAGAGGAVGLAILRAHPWLSEPSDLVRLVAYLAVGGVILAVATTPVALGQAGERPRRSATMTVTPDLIEELTPRETDVLRLAAGGLSVRAIGRRLSVSPNTVKSHLLHAYGKLGAHNRAEAIAAGLRHGYLDADDLAAR